MSTDKRNVVLAFLGFFSIMLFWIDQTSCHEERKVYTCTACFMDRPQQCVTYQEDDSNWLSRGEEKEARDFAKYALCRAVGKKEGKEADRACSKKDMDEFIITCTSRMINVRKYPEIYPIGHY